MRAVALILAGALAGCTGDDDAIGSTTEAGGRVIIAGTSGVLVDAHVRVDQVEYLAPPPEVVIREHVGETITSAEGYWWVDGRQLSGQYLVTISGGTFTDPLTGATIALDPADAVEAFLEIELGSKRDDYLITPVSIATAAAARSRFASGADERFGLSLAFAAEHVHAHFGALDWHTVQLADLSVPAASPTDGVRAAWVLGAIDTLARDLAGSADASPNEVNPYRLAQAWAADLGRAELPRFDGNDGDEPGGGLKLGAECPDPVPGCVLPACDTAACRPACELYSSTARVAVAGAVLSFTRSSANQTGLPDSDALAMARAIQNNTDPVLFDPDDCIEELDQVGPELDFVQPTPLPGFVRGMITVKASADDLIDRVPVVTFEGRPDQDGNLADFQATTTIDTTLEGDTLTVIAQAVDDAGNVTTAMRSWDVDNVAPVLTVDPTGFHVDGAGHWWVLPPMSTGPMMSGTVEDDHGATVQAFRGAQLLADASVNGMSWSLALPLGTVADTTGADITIVATDPAGNTTSAPRRLRYDDTPPVLSLIETSVRDESSDAIAFATLPQPQYGNVPGYDPTHNHAPGAPVMLGRTPAPACTTTAAPVVTKHAYLLDEDTPPYVSESGGAGVGGRNPLLFRFTLTDSGVGIDASQTAFRVLDGAGAVLLDWTALPAGTPIVDGGGQVIGRDHEVPLYRAGATAPSVPGLNADGLYRVELRGGDFLGREVTDARCWNLRLLPSPIYVGNPQQATHGPAGSGKYGLGALRLEDTSSPYDPVAAQVLNDTTAGSGLVEFPVWNPTTSTVYVALDLTRPTGATYAKTVLDGWWARFSEMLVDYDCGIINNPPPEQSTPNYTLPGCGQVPPSFPAPTETSASAGTSAGFTVRVFEEVSASSMPVLIPCATCALTSTPGPASGVQRFVVQLPPRGYSSAAPRKFWIMPAVETIVELRPGSSPPYFEHSVINANNESVVVTGVSDSSQNFCKAWVLSGGTYRCTTRAIYRRYKVLMRATFSIPSFVTTDIRVSRDGQSLLQPRYLVDNLMIERQSAVAPWSTAEPCRRATMTSPCLPTPTP